MFHVSWPTVLDYKCRCDCEHALGVRQGVADLNTAELPERGSAAKVTISTGVAVAEANYTRKEQLV